VKPEWIAPFPSALFFEWNGMHVLALYLERLHLDQKLQLFGYIGSYFPEKPAFICGDSPNSVAYLEVMMDSHKNEKDPVLARALIFESLTRVWSCIIRSLKFSPHLLERVMDKISRLELSAHSHGVLIDIFRKLSQRDVTDNYFPDHRPLILSYLQQLLLSV
jgi:hypothetical protein